MRMVFVADRADASGLAAWELPLAYVSEEDFKQPIFTGACLDGTQGGNMMEAEGSRCSPL